jgi:RHS repeat-associated protein
MPHDHSAFDPTADAQHKTGGGILAQMKAAGRSLVARAKHGAGAQLVSAVLLAAAAFTMPHTAEAQAVYTVTNYGNGDAKAINGLGQGAGANQSQRTSAQHPLLFSNGTTTNLGSLGGSNGGEAYGINDSSQIVGWSSIPAGNSHAFFYTNGTMSDLGTLPTCNSNSQANAINDSGVIVGQSSGNNVNCPLTIEFRAFTYSNGVMSDLGTPAGQGSIATAINNNGQIAGSLLTYSNLGQQLGSQAFLYNSGTTTTLGNFGGSFTDAYGINNSAQVVGRSTFSSGSEHAFLSSGGTMTDLGTLGGANSIAFGINDSGQIVGWAYNAGSSQRAFVYSNGTMTDLNSVTMGLNGDTLYTALGINNAGQIIALGLTNNVYVLSPPPAKALGAPGNGDCGCGDPITVGTGNVFEQTEDYKTTGQNPLGFTRYYNSLGNLSNPGTFATSLGTNWRSNFDRYLNILSPSSVQAERPDGQVLKFTLTGSTWTPDTDVNFTLTNAGSTWTLTGPDDTVESYTASGSKGTLNSIQARNGYTQLLSYSGGLLSSVTDTYNRALNFTYTGGLLQTLSTPDNLTFTYGFTPVGAGHVLSSVAYSTTPATSITYQYGNASFPFALTGILDENNQQFSSWTYDTQGRGHTSQRGGSLGADLTTVTFNSNGTTTVTNAFGVSDTYTFSALQGVPKMTQISRAATSTTAAASRFFGYDSNGYLSSEYDWNGNSTTYVNNTQGNPTTINYAVGSPVAFSVTISYDPVFTHLPHQIVTPGLTSTFAYETGTGNLLTRTDLDTTTNSIPYSTNGQTRVTTYTWLNDLLASVQLPRRDVVAKTSYTYGADGALTQIKDALNHQTNITAHTGGGLPLTVVDPNNVTTTLAYDGRLHLHTSIVQTGAGNLTTTWTYDAANNLQSVQQPDNSKITYGYDAAHRLTSATDLFNNVTSYTPDAMGGITLTNVKDSTGTLKRTHSAVFDALDRMTSDIGGMSQTTTFAYDKMGNVLTITPPAPSGAITQTFDALNRLKSSTDPAPGGSTIPTYDAHARVVSVRDANGNTTSYVYDGFGDRTQTASPDSGTTVYHYDPDRNLTTAALPGSITKNYTFDALDRPLTTTYTGDTTLNVSRTYDQPTGHGFGIGRLTSATDQPGSLSLTYDERGNITAESRTVTGAGTLNMSTGYDAASNISSITYPSGTVAAYSRDTMGRVTGITAKPPGAGSPSNVATGITYEPFGPVTGLAFGNGLTESRSYDTDYRSTTITATAPTVQNLTYGYFANNSVNTITDAVNSLNSQTLGYDALDRLTSAASGTGGYGTWSWTWDPVNNVKTQVVNGTTTNFGYTALTNKIASYKTGTTTTNVAYTPAGNINTLKVGTSTIETLSYNKANEMASSQTTSSSASYKYDLDGQRIEKLPPGSNPILYQFGRTAGELLAENDLHAGQTADYIYLNGKPIGEVNPTNGKLYFMHTDRLGTPDTVTDSTKAVVWNAFYRPFGDNGLGGVSGTLATQSLRLPGQQFDPETGYNHNGFRDYAGTLTRYVQTDPIGLSGGTNTYQYAGGNPLKWTDRRGLQTGPYTETDIQEAGPLAPVLRQVNRNADEASKLSDLTSSTQDVKESLSLIKPPTGYLIDISELPSWAQQYINMTTDEALKKQLQQAGRVCTLSDPRGVLPPELQGQSVHAAPPLKKLILEPGDPPKLKLE